MKNDKSPPAENSYCYIFSSVKNFQFLRIWIEYLPSSKFQGIQDSYVSDHGV